MGAEEATMQSGPRTSVRWLHFGLWAAQGLLALAFGMAGVLKVSAPLAELAHKMAWTAAVPGPLVRFIGASELTGVLGLILPSVTRIRPKLTALAGAGLATVMVLAMAFHLSRGEAHVIGVNLVLGSLAAFVAWGRFRGAPIPPRA